MNILYVFAHPESKSLSGALKNFAIKRLEENEHHVQLSDLYAMKWKTTLDADDMIKRENNTRFDPSSESKFAFEQGLQATDIAFEQEKLRWADMVIFQFPLWWFSMPAIMRGWFDRVYACGFAYGVGEHSDTHWGDRYGEGRLAGKRAMLVVTTGGWESHYSPRGINGPIDDILFPIQHGMLYYPGFDVLPPFVVYRSGRIDHDLFDATCQALGHRLDALFTSVPIPFRPQNAGDYDIPELTLRSDIKPEQTGFGIHTK